MLALMVLTFNILLEEGSQNEIYSSVHVVVIFIYIFYKIERVPRTNLNVAVC